MAGHTPSAYSSDERITRVMDLIVKFAAGDFSQRGEYSQQGDEIDAIIIGLNALADELQSARKVTQHYLNRIEKVMHVLLKYTMLDFSETLEVSDEKDEIDAIAIGLNTLAEELRAAREQEARQMQTIEENREQIEIIINNAPNAVIVINQDSNILRWNKKAEEVFGWKVEEVLNKRLHQFIMPDKHVSAHYDGIQHFLETGEGPLLNQVIEISAVRRNGEEFPIEIAISAVKSRNNFLFIAFINDISARKKAQAELLNLNHHLEASNKELEAFTYSVSHDLRAPLRAISGYSQLLTERAGTGLDAQTTGFIHSISANTKRMGRLIDDLLSLSRFSRAELQRTTINVNELVNNVIAELSQSDKNFAKTQITVRDLPPVKADYNLLQQVYINLIANAVKYSSLKEKPTVEIGSLKKAGKTVYFVKDNGSGFDMEFYNKLFGVFQRLHDSREFEGTGVGLAIVKRIITKHQGEIWAESEVDKGATFYFTLS
jgi:PAS domain S-box-containing protein